MSLVDLTTSNTLSNTATTGQSTTTGNNNLSGNQSQANVYTPQQLGLQNLAAGNTVGLLDQTKLGPSGVNPAMAQYANMLYRQNVAPTIAANLGPGSPAIAGGQQQLNLGLAAMAGQQDFQNRLAAIGLADQAAYNPVGVNATSAQQGAQTQTTNNALNSQTNQHFNQVGVDGGALLDLGQSTLQGLAGWFMQ